jgi:hypothetical protein
MNVQLLTNFRCGSNRLIKLIEQNFDSSCLYEPFANQEFTTNEEKTTTWINFKNKVILYQFNKECFAEFNPNDYLEHKINIIKETLENNSYVWKSQPNEWKTFLIQQKIINLLPTENTKIISRRNVLEQIASYQLARNIGNWIKPVDFNGKFKIEKHIAEDILQNKQKLESLSDDILYYEDMPDNPNEAIEWMGFKRNKDIKEFQTKINENILNNVLNIKEAETWIEEFNAK